MRNHNYLFALTAFLFLSACQMNSSHEEKDENAVDSTSVSTPLSQADRNKIKNLIASVSPPVELAYIMNDLDVKFSPGILSSPEYVEHYDRSLDQALAMGVYGADLVYCHLYARTDLAKTYLEAIQALSQKLGMKDIIDFDKLWKIAENKVYSEELTVEFNREMEKVFQHLENTNQLNLSAMMSFGGWIESIYIATVVGKEVGEYSEEMIDLIYYESLLSKTFLDIFGKFDQIPGYEKTFEEMEKLTRMHKDFEVALEKVDARVVHHDSITQVVDVSEQSIAFNEEKLTAFINQIQLIRTEVIK